MESQCEQVLRYMRDFGSITPMDAIREFTITRLGARIYDLRKAGYTIKTENVISKNRYGKTIWYAKYSLEE